MDKELKIGVYFTNQNEQHICLPETSAYFSKLKIIPLVNDGITIMGNDYKILNIEPTSFQNIITVKRRWFNYNHDDVAVICNYQAW